MKNFSQTVMSLGLMMCLNNLVSLWILCSLSQALINILILLILAEKTSVYANMFTNHTENVKYVISFAFSFKNIFACKFIHTHTLDIHISFLIVLQKHPMQHNGQQCLHFSVAFPQKQPPFSFVYSEQSSIIQYFIMVDRLIIFFHSTCN